VGDEGDEGDDRSEWEELAEWWAERFSEGADAEYEEQILPLLASELAGSGRVVDIGCGEGQVARLAARGGARSIGIDASWSLVSIARGRGGGPAFGRALATALPFRESSFDAAVVCLVLEHLDDLEAVASEIARVLEPGGRLCCVLNHPLTQTPGSGQIDDHTVDPPERYWRVGPYLVEQAGVEQVERGVFIRFVHRPLSRYVNALADAGLTIERMIEPRPPETGEDHGLLADPHLAAVPRLLYLRLGRAVE
jgi:SAM-dependent methyltransferase